MKKRVMLQTVTLPILVAARNAREADGRAPFESKQSGLVRMVTDDDAKNWRKKEFISAEDHALFTGISLLNWAWREKDEFTATRAYEKLEPYIQSNTPKLRKAVPLGGGISLMAGGWNMTTVPSAYTWLVSAKLSAVRFVAWYSESEGRFLPGLYCPERKAAVFAMAIIRRIRVCPLCDAPFIPAAGNVDYCSVKHREAYRVKRFRHRQKETSRGNSAHEPT